MKSQSSGSSLLAVLFTMTAVSAAMAVVFSITTNYSRMAQHTVDRAQALAYGDAVVENLYEQWRQTMIGVSNSTDRTDGVTNSYLATRISPPSTAVLTPLPGISLASSPTVLAATPLLVELTSSTARPVPENGTKSSQRKRLYYIATARVQFPQRGGTSIVTIKRAFVRGGRSIFDNFYFGTQPATEFHPGAPMYVSGTAYIGGDLYTAHDQLHFTKDVTFLGSQFMNYRSNDSRYGNAPTIPNNGFGDNWDLNNAPRRGSEQKLFDAPITSLDPNFLDDISSNDTDSDGNLNNDGYREIIEEANSAYPDPLQIDPLSADPKYSGSERLANNADYRITVAADNTVTVSVANTKNPLLTTDPRYVNLPTSDPQYIAINSAITTNTAIKDVRDADYVKMVTLDVAKLRTYTNPASGSPVIADKIGAGDGLTLYIKDTSSGNTGTDTASGNQTKIVNSTTGTLVKNVTSSGGRGVKLINGEVLPSAGLTVATPHSVYIAGDYNTGSTTAQPPSNSANSYSSGDPSPVVGTYVRPPSAVIGDAVNMLSNAWNDANSDSSITSRVANRTTVNTAIVSGNVPTKSGSGNYSGGIENFIRFHENWGGKYFTIYGTVALLYDSEEATRAWGTASYNPPDRHWYFDPLFQDANPPGFRIARTYDRGRWVAH